MASPCGRPSPRYQARVSPFGSMAQMASFDESVGAGDEQRTGGVHGQVIGGHAGLQRGVHEDLPLRD